MTLDSPARRETYWRGSISGKRAVGCTRTTAGTGEGRFSRLGPQVCGGGGKRDPQARGEGKRDPQARGEGKRDPQARGEGKRSPRPRGVRLRLGGGRCGGRGGWWST